MSLHAVANRALYHTSNTVTLPYDGLLDLCFDNSKFVPIFAYESNYKNFIKTSENLSGIDVVIYNHITEQSEQAKTICRMSHCNSLLIVNDFPNGKPSVIAKFKEKIKEADFVVANGEYIQLEWGLDYYVMPSIPEFPLVKKTNLCTMAGNFNEEDLNTANLIYNRLNPSVVDTSTNFPGFLSALSKSTFFICPTNDISCESAILWAMAHGCIVLTNKSEWSKQWVFNEINGFTLDKLQDCISIVNDLDEASIAKISSNAQSYVRSSFPMTNKLKLNRVINEASKKVWIL